MFKRFHWLLALSCLAPLIAACGCPEDRAPSGLDMSLESPLPTDIYTVTVCIDSVCDSFTGVGESGHYLNETGDWEVELDVQDDRLQLTSWRQIAPGDHEVVVELAGEGGTTLDFSGTVEFDRIDRCHAEDSTTAIDL